MQYTYDVTLRRVRESYLPRKISKYYILACEFMRACVRACTWARGRVHAFTCM